MPRGIKFLKPSKTILNISWFNTASVSVSHIIYYSRNEAHQDQDTSFLTGSDSASDFIDLTQKF